MTTPVLETEHLRLREWRLDDFAAFAAFWSDPVMTRFVGGVQNQAQAWRKMAAYAGHWLLRGYDFWVMERREDNVPIGYCGHWYPADWPEAEIGWAVYPRAPGQGICHRRRPRRTRTRVWIVGLANCRQLHSRGKRRVAPGGGAVGRPARAPFRLGGAERVPLQIRIPEPNLNFSLQTSRRNPWH